MKILFLSLSILLFPTLSMAQEQPQQSQQVCNTREVIVGALKGKYNEIPVAMGLVNNGLMMELFSSPDGATWSIAMTRPDKVMCLVTGGEYLINLIGKPQKKGQDINALPVE